MTAGCSRCLIASAAAKMRAMWAGGGGGQQQYWGRGDCPAIGDRMEFAGGGGDAAAAAAFKKQERGGQIGDVKMCEEKEEETDHF